MGDTMANAYCVIITAVDDKDEAIRLSRLLVSQKLAACIQHIDVDSFFTFEGKPYEDEEILMVIKTRTELYAKIQAVLLAEHPYKLPEMLCLPINDGLPAYFKWLDENTVEA